MRRIAAIAAGVLLLLAVAMIVNVWHGARDPVTRAPGPLETARAQLHGQLDAAKKAESQAEQQAWNSPTQLRILIQGHEQRIDRLKDNKEAAEIVAYDQEAVDRLEKRIAQMAQEQAAKAEAAEQAAKADASKGAARQSQQP